MPEYSCLKPYACSSVTAIAQRSFFYRAVASWNNLTVVRQETLHLFIVLYCIVRPRKNKSISNEVTDILSTAPVTSHYKSGGVGCFNMVAILKEKGQPFYVITAGLKTVLKRPSIFPQQFQSQLVLKQTQQCGKQQRDFLFVTELNQLSHTYLIKQFRFIPMYILLLLVLSNSLHTKLAPVDALSFRFQLEMTMGTKVAFFPQIHDHFSFFCFLNIIRQLPV